jgi:jouberin
MNSQYIANRLFFVLNPEMQGDAINCLKLMPPETKDLLVHSRDNCLRILELNSSEGKYNEEGISTGAITGRFFGTITEKLNVRSTVSPCGEYVLSGSEDGKPHMWDNLAIVQPSSQF